MLRSARARQQAALSWWGRARKKTRNCVACLPGAYPSENANCSELRGIKNPLVSQGVEMVEPDGIEPTTSTMPLCPKIMET